MNNSTLSANGKRNYLLILSFAAVYIIWGSTYLAIRFALESIPPFFMAGIRFVIAGGIMYAIARFTGAPKPGFLHIKNAAVIGLLLLVFGNGGVVYAEQMVPSGIAALVVTVEPLWVVLILWLGKSGKAPSWYVWMGLLLGVAGMIVLVGPESSELNRMSVAGFCILLASTFSWALGSVYAINAAVPASSIMATSIQMLAGGVFLSILSGIFGEWNSVHMEQISLASLLAVLYLIVFGSIVGYTAYSYLTRTVAPGQVSTYAYVNPVIAVLLGTWLGNEALTKEILIATPLLIIAVMLLLWKQPTHK